MILAYCSVRFGVSFWFRYWWGDVLDGEGSSCPWCHCEVNTVSTQVYKRRSVNGMIRPYVRLDSGINMVFFCNCFSWCYCCYF